MGKCAVSVRGKFKVCDCPLINHEYGTCKHPDGEGLCEFDHTYPKQNQCPLRSEPLILVADFK